MDLETLISQTVALSWDDSTPLSFENQPIANIGLFGYSITPKQQNSKMVKEVLNKPWSFAVPFHMVVHARNKFIFTFNHPNHVSKILKQVMECEWFFVDPQTMVP